MSKQITVFEFNKEIAVKDNVKNLIVAKREMEKALQNVKKIEKIYSDEIGEYKDAMHITRGGDIIFIEDMTAEHLLNTIRVFLESGYGYNSSGIKKYVKEVKKRGLVTEMLALDVGEENDDDFLVDGEDEEQSEF